MYCIVWYSSIYIAPLNSHGQTEALLVRLAPRKETSLRSVKDVERLDDRREARAEGERRFQREEAITEKDLDDDYSVEQTIVSQTENKFSVVKVSHVSVVRNV